MSLSEHPVGSVCWIDLGIVDVNAAAAFYGQLFGWAVATPDESGYRLASLHGHLVAALGPANDPGARYWTVYLHTADIAASVDAVTAAGGTVVVPPARAADAGVSAAVRDPRGAPLSLWQPGTHSGTYASGKHGTLAGIQLHIDDLEDTRDFLRAALGWQVQPGGTITRQGRTVATWSPRPGTGRSPRPSPWLVSFCVADVAATCERALKLGATAPGLEPNVLVDPAGALFAITSKP